MEYLVWDEEEYVRESFDENIHDLKNNIFQARNSIQAFKKYCKQFHCREQRAYVLLLDEIRETFKNKFNDCDEETNFLCAKAELFETYEIFKMVYEKVEKIEWKK